MTGPRDPKPTILLVDDDAVGTAVASRYLQMNGFTPIVSNSPFGVLKLMHQHEPAVIVLDVEMPGLDGLALAKLIRGTSKLASTRIVLHSAHTLPTELPEIADRFVPKRGNPRDLLDVIRELLRSSASR